MNQCYAKNQISGKIHYRAQNKQFCTGCKKACVASVSVRFRSKERGTRVSQRPREKMAQVKEQGGGGEETHLPSFIFYLSFHFSRGQNRKSPSSVLFCSETKRKRLLRRLAVKWPIGSANTLLSHGPGNEETSRKWGSLRGSPSGIGKSGSPRIIVGAIFDATTVFLSKMNPRRRWKVCSLAWEAALNILNHGKRVNCKISGVETL